MTGRPLGNDVGGSGDDWTASAEMTRGGVAAWVEAAGAGCWIPAYAGMTWVGVGMMAGVSRSSRALGVGRVWVFR